MTYIFVAMRKKMPIGIFYRFPRLCVTPQLSESRGCPRSKTSRVKP